mgnify:FL=1
MTNLPSTEIHVAPTREEFIDAYIPLSLGIADGDVWTPKPDHTFTRRVQGGQVYEGKVRQQGDIYEFYTPDGWRARINVRDLMMRVACKVIAFGAEHTVSPTASFADGEE